MPRIHDAYADMGPLAGILTALEAHPEAAWLVVACDLPYLGSGTLAALVAGRDPSLAATAFASAQKAGDRRAKGAHGVDGKGGRPGEPESLGPGGELPEPLCAIYEPRSRERLRELMPSGIDCPRKAIIRSPSRVLPAPGPKPPRSARIHPDPPGPAHSGLPRLFLTSASRPGYNGRAMNRLLAFALFACLCLPAASRASILGDDYNADEGDDYASLPAFRLSGEYGFSQWLMPSDSIETEKGKAFFEDLERGWNTSADAVWFFLPRGGAGLTWIRFHSEATVRGEVLFEGYIAVDRTQKTLFNYIGPSFWTRMRAGRFGLLHAGFGGGLLDVDDSWVENGESYVVKARTYALVTSLGYDYTLMRFLGLGLNGRFFFSNITEYTLNGVKHEVIDVENKYSAYNIPLYRLELNLGLRVYLF